jgi:hypothetical protein
MKREYIMSRYASDLEELRDAVADAVETARRKGFAIGDVGMSSMRVGLEIEDGPGGARVMVLVLS